MVSSFEHGEMVARRWADPPTAISILRLSYENHGVSQASLVAWLRNSARGEPSQREQLLRGLYTNLPGMRELHKRAVVTSTLPPRLQAYVETVDTPAPRMVVPCFSETGGIVGLRAQLYPAWGAPRVSDVILDQRVQDVGTWFGAPGALPVYISDLHSALVLGAFVPRAAWRLQLNWPAAVGGAMLVFQDRAPNLSSVLQFVAGGGAFVYVSCAGLSQTARALAGRADPLACDILVRTPVYAYVKDAFRRMCSDGCSSDMCDALTAARVPAAMLDMGWETALEHDCHDAAKRLSALIMGTPQ